MKQYITTTEIIKDFNSVPADISEVEWITRQNHEFIVDDLRKQLKLWQYAAMAQETFGELKVLILKSDAGPEPE